MGLVIPSRAGAKNRLYSEADIRRIRQIQRLTQEMGVNLAGVEVILRLLEDMEGLRQDVEQQMTEYVRDADQRIRHMMTNPNAPIRRDETLLPVPNIRIRKSVEI